MAVIIIVALVCLVALVGSIVNGLSHGNKAVIEHTTTQATDMTRKRAY